MKRFKLMTFNIRGSFQEADKKNLWKNRSECNVKTILRHNPDVIGFQEMQIPNTETYAVRLPDYGVRPGITVDVEKVSGWVMHNPIYWRGFEKVDCGGFYLSPTPDTWSKGWDASFVRSATWAILRSDDVTFLYINTHLDHIGETARVESAKLIVQKIAEIGGDLPAIVTADFNSRAWAPEHEADYPYPPAIIRSYLPPPNTVHKVFTDAGFRDSYIEAGYTNQMDMNTYHSFMGANFPPAALRIDWILVRDGKQKIKVETCQIIRDHEGQTYPSDHYPVMASLSIE